jgi:energy-coupling factor transporter ATP-binding protein EcfA2
VTGLRMAAAAAGPLAGIDLALAPGARGWLRGPAASGKTLVLSLAAGLVLPHSGSVAVAGAPPAPGRVAMLFQNPDYQLLAATVVEDVALNRASPEAADAALATAGASAFAEAAVGALTPGQRRRAALAGVLAAEPAVALLDTPFAGMEADEAAALWAGVAAFTEHRGIAVLASGPPPDGDGIATIWEVAQWHTQTAGR